MTLRVTSPSIEQWGRYFLAKLGGQAYFCLPEMRVSLGLSPFPVIVTTRIISCLVGDSYKPSFATITGKGDNPRYHLVPEFL